MAATADELTDEELARFGITPEDEYPHPYSPDHEWWNESWFWDWFTPDGSLAGHLRLGWHPNQERVWLWLLLYNGSEWLVLEETRLPRPTCNSRGPLRPVRPHLLVDARSASPSRSAQGLGLRTGGERRAGGVRAPGRHRPRLRRRGATPLHGAGRRRGAPGRGTTAPAASSSRSRSRGRRPSAPTSWRSPVSGRSATTSWGPPGTGTSSGSSVSWVAASVGSSGRPSTSRGSTASVSATTRSTARP
ncbi:MAG: hypothetical protein U5R31_09625 [Acidimicrobiia bacterium]|nr:hypothetical protein [Acidimicrobiia bacterium]